MSLNTRGISSTGINLLQITELFRDRNVSQKTHQMCTMLQGQIKQGFNYGHIKKGSSKEKKHCGVQEGRNGAYQRIRGIKCVQCYRA